MISKDKYNEVLEHGLTLDHYFLLCNLRNNVPLSNNKRIQGFINLLTKKDYIKDDVLTEKALDLISECEFSKEVVLKDEKKEVVTVNIEDWVRGLHSRCEQKLLKLTGKKQVRDKINNKPYAFLPNVLDLTKNIFKIMTIYKIKNLDKVEYTIMKYIDSCYAAKNWFPTLYYYIMKDGKSNLVADMDTMEDMNEEERKDYGEIIKNKDLF